MSSANTLPTSDHDGSEARAHEPSMEEILASIRRIIADDQSLPGRLAEAAEPAQAPSSPVHVLRASYQSHAAPADMDPAFVDPAPAHPDHAVAFGSHGAEDEAAWSAEQMAPYGDIAAPQFASPEGPGQHWAPDQAHGDGVRAATMAELHASHSAPHAESAPHVVRPERTVPEHPAPAHEDHGRMVLTDDDAPHPVNHPVSQGFGGGAGRFGHAETHGQDPAYGDVGWDEDHTPHAEADDEAAHLFSEATDQSVASAFNMLAASRIADNSDELLALAREMIRPLLRSWIDENLPGMVERLVRAEIERVARGR